MIIIKNRICNYHKEDMKTYKNNRLLHWLEIKICIMDWGPLKEFQIDIQRETLNSEFYLWIKITDKSINKCNIK
jgi:hypothetical protein